MLKREKSYGKMRDQAALQPRKEKRPPAEVKTISLSPRFLQYSMNFIIEAFSACLRHRQNSLNIHPKEKDSQGKDHKGITKRSIPKKSVTTVIDFQAVYENLRTLPKQLAFKTPLLLLLAASKLVGADCPLPYSCPDFIQPFPDASNGCNTTSYMEAFNATFNFSCELMYSLNNSAGTALFQAAIDACMYPTTPSSVKSQGVDALFYSNATLCASNSTIIGASGKAFDPLWFLVLLVLVPILCYGGKCLKQHQLQISTLFQRATREDDKNIRDEEKGLAAGAVEQRAVVPQDGLYQGMGM